LANNRNKAVFVLTLVSMTAAVQGSWAQDSYFGALVVDCRKSIGGNMENVQVQINLKDLFNNDNNGWGTAAEYNSDSNNWTDAAFANCNGKPIRHRKVSIDHGWWTKMDVPINGVTYPNITFTHADNKAYWDWYYEGYNAPEACDYTQNCHGFAFGRGHCLYDAVDVMGVGLNETQNGTEIIWPANACYVTTKMETATIATDIFNHSIKVVGKLCPFVPQGPPIPGDDKTGAPPPYPIISRSEEQFLESGTYWRTGDCPVSLNINLAHARERGRHPGVGYNFIFIKPK
jgi:hypothetical protein